MNMMLLIIVILYNVLFWGMALVAFVVTWGLWMSMLMLLFGVVLFIVVWKTMFRKENHLGVS